MIKCDNEKLEVKGSRNELLTELTLIFSNLIKEGAINDAEDLLVVFEAVSKDLRNEFDNKEEK